ncbi:MAG TPA: hypothetical protein VL098_03690 [Flavipsychrobacter sp.]|nr:hypothetical protein [Flavipsychrobacter sp.]
MNKRWIFFLVISLFFSCNKKEDEVPDPTPVETKSDFDGLWNVKGFRYQFIDSSVSTTPIFTLDSVISDPALAEFILFGKDSSYQTNLHLADTVKGSYHVSHDTIYMHSAWTPTVETIENYKFVLSNNSLIFIHHYDGESPAHLNIQIDTLLRSNQ